MKGKFSTLKGFRDFFPQKIEERQYALKILGKAFKRFGYEPLETPALEYQDVLLGKYGDEADKLIYKFTDKGQRKIGLRYDQTVPTARVLATYQDIPKPFRRYQIQPVWRAEKPQKGRYREFLQCDADIFGSRSPIADAETIALASYSFRKLGFKNFKVFVNDRNILFSLLNEVNIDKKKQLPVIQIMDKLDKKSKNDIEGELKEKGIKELQIKNLFEKIKKASPTDTLTQIIRYAKKLGVKENEIEFKPFLARGLDYYTSTIFEVFIEGSTVGAVAGGGRFDNLIEKLGGPSIPAVGISYGFDRIMLALKRFNLLPKEKSSADVLVTIFNEEDTEKALEIVNSLRESKINSIIYPDNKARLDKQLKYADKKRIPFVLIIGDEEIKQNLVTLKNMSKKDQTTISLETAISNIKQASED